MGHITTTTPTRAISRFRIFLYYSPLYYVIDASRHVDVPIDAGGELRELFAHRIRRRARGGNGAT